jgi:Glycosyl hydrolases family 38 N-terminal domain/Glycosyl hydrolases family 38 C-terminal domain
MTTRALVRTARFDVDLARESLRRRAAATETILAGRRVRVFAEPLFKYVSGAGLCQSVRIDALETRPKSLDSAPAPRAAFPGVLSALTRAVARTRDGSQLPCHLEQGPAGIRVLVPVVREPTRIQIELPELADSAAVEVQLRPERRWSIHLIHHTHLDIGYTDPQGRVLAEHLSFLDSCLDLVRETDDWPEPARFKWAVEALWSFDRWAKARPMERVAEFVDRVKQGRIELTAMPFNLHTETCATDELHELLRLACDTARLYAVGFTSAMQTDVPGSVVGLVDALSQAGVRYLAVAHNWAGRSVPHLTGGQDVPRLFRWQAPGGASLLVWVTDTPHGLAYMEGPLLGFDTSFDLVDDLLPAYLISLANNPYPFDGTLFGFPVANVTLHRKPYAGDVLHLRVQGKFGDNAPPRRVMSEIVRRWNETWAYPRLRLSRNEDFFVEAERRIHDIPTFQGDWNDWWADGVGSGARPVQLVRRAQGVVADAQTLSTIGGSHGAAGAADDTCDAKPVYLSLALFDEHTWGASNPWTHGDDCNVSGEEQWHWKYATALSAHDGANALLDRAIARLSAELSTADQALASLYVINTCSWSRTDIVTAFLPESRVRLEAEFIVVDSRSGRSLPFERLPQVNETHRDAGQFLRILVQDVPALGGVRLDVRRGASVAPTGFRHAGEAASILENEHLRVQVDLATASIASIVDKSANRELVRADATFGFNAYVYDRYATAGGINHASSAIEGDDRLRLLGTRSLSRPAALVERASEPLGERLVYESVAEGAAWLRTTLSLAHSVARLDIENRIAKSATMAKESAYFAFPFAMDSPSLHIEVSGGVVGTGIPSVPGGAAHMRAMRRWISLEQDGEAIAWSTQDAPLVQVGEIALPYAPFPSTTPRRDGGTIYSWVHNNLWDTNFPSQQGFEMNFRYSVASRPRGSALPGPVLGMRTAASTSRPLVAVMASSRQRGRLDERIVQPYLTLDNDYVRVVGLTTPRPGHVLVRLQSFADLPLDVRLRPAWPVQQAHQATFLGEPLRDLPVDSGTISLRVDAFGVAAVRLSQAEA